MNSSDFYIVDVKGLDYKHLKDYVEFLKASDIKTIKEEYQQINLFKANFRHLFKDIILKDILTNYVKPTRNYLMVDEELPLFIGSIDARFEQLLINTSGLANTIYDYIHHGLNEYDNDCYQYYELSNTESILRFINNKEELIDLTYEAFLDICDDEIADWSFLVYLANSLDNYSKFALKRYFNFEVKLSDRSVPMPNDSYDVYLDCIDSKTKEVDYKKACELYINFIDYVLSHFNNAHPKLLSTAIKNKLL